MRKQLLGGGGLDNLNILISCREVCGAEILKNNILIGKMGCGLLMQWVNQSQELDWEMWVSLKLSSQSFFNGYTHGYDYLGSNTTNYRDVL